jgi:hypothetical protein
VGFQGELKEKKSDLSPEKIIEVAKTIYQIEIKNPHNGTNEKVNLILNDSQKYVVKLLGL